MAKYDHGGGCPCGLYSECPPSCGSSKETDQRRQEQLALVKTLKKHGYFIDNLKRHKLEEIKDAIKWHQEEAINRVYDNFDHIKFTASNNHLLAVAALKLYQKAINNA